MAGLTLENVRKVYDNGYVAVKGATFDVADGEFIVLVGPSGCGKSTILRMIAGLETISSGVLRIGERVVNDLPPKDRDVAMVFQNYALYPHLNVFDNMAFGLKLRKVPKDEIRRRVEEAAEVLGITSILDRKPRQLSGGQRQRVAVGRAIVRDPAVFLFDEPLSNLDAKLRVQMRTEISRLHHRLKATMIYVTHDQVEAMTMGDRIVVLRDGVIQQIDTPLNLYHHPANMFVAGFIGSPAMNFIPGRVDRADGLRFVARDVPLSLRLDASAPSWLRERVGYEVILGVRPEDLHLAPHVETAGPVAEATFTLDVVEPMGNEVFLYARLPGAPLVARVRPLEIPEPGTDVRLAFDLARLHFFDPATEANLALPAGRVAA